MRLTGICKGSGMIHPQMATMIGYILDRRETDSGIGKGADARSGRS